MTGGCRRASEATPSRFDREAAAPTDASQPQAEAGAEAEARLAPLPSEPLFTNLSIPGFPEAVVSVPNGATSPRPVIVVLHGSADRPDWNCDAWRHVTGARGFVLCPRGQYEPRESMNDDRRFTHHGGARLRAHVDSSLEALARRFGAYVDVGRPLVAGFSLDAMEIGELALEAPTRFSRVAQLEGGDRLWTWDAARRFSARGGRRVLFACGSKWCASLGQVAASRLQKSGVDARVVFAPVGHTTDRPLQEAIMAEFAWWVDSDARWAAP